MPPLHIKFGFNWPSSLGEEDNENNGHIHVCSTGAAADNSISINFLTNLSFAAFIPLNDFVTVFPISNA